MDDTPTRGNGASRPTLNLTEPTARSLLVKELAPAVVCISTSPRQGLSHHALELVCDLALAHGAMSACSTTTADLIMAVDDEPGPGAVADAMSLVANADIIVIGAPVHRGAVSGMTRHWCEVFRADLAGRIVIPVVAAGSIRSHLAADAFRADLIINFHALAERPVVVTDDLPHDELSRRLDEALVQAFGRVAEGAQ